MQSNVLDQSVVERIKCSGADGGVSQLLMLEALHTKNL